MANVRTAQVCESCVETVLEESGGDLDRKTAIQLAKDMGSEIVDHYCEAVDAPTIECACECRIHRS